MTKIKNTKKGMAKKTLSISLAVAMLATSNVPVWAAEFTDGTDAAFTSKVEAPVEVVDEAPVVEEEVAADTEAKADALGAEDLDLSGVTVKVGADDVNGKNVTYGSQLTVGGSIKKKTDNTNLEGFSYGYRIKGQTAALTTGEVKDGDLSKMSTALYDGVWNDALGKTVQLYIFREDDAAVFHNVILAEFTLVAKEVSGNVEVEFNGESSLFAKEGTNYTVAYSGKEYTYSEDDTDKNSFKVTKLVRKDGKEIAGEELNKYDIKAAPAILNAGDVMTVTATPKADSGLKGEFVTNITVIKRSGSTAKADEHLTAEVNEKLTYEYTGNTIDIPNDKITVKEIQGKYADATLTNVVADADTVDSNVGESTVNVVLNSAAVQNFDLKNGATLKTVDSLGYTVSIVRRDLSKVNVKLGWNDNGTFRPLDFVPENVKASDLYKYLVFNAADGTQLNLKSTDYSYTITRNGQTIKLTETLNSQGAYTVDINAVETNGNCVNGLSFEFNVGEPVSHAESQNGVQYYYSGNEYKPGKTELGRLDVYGKKATGSDLVKLGVVDTNAYEIVGYKNNTNAGAAAATVKVTNGTFNGRTFDVIFKILPLEITQDTVTVPEVVSIDKKFKTAAEYKVQLVVTADDPNKTIVKGLTEKDFSVSYKFVDANQSGEAANELHDEIQATIVSTNPNFVTKPDVAGLTLDAKTEIVAAALTNDMVKVNPSSYTYTGKAVTPNYYVMDKDGINVLYDEADYGKYGEYRFVRCENNLNVGTAKVVVEGANDNYYGKASATFEITPANTKDVKVEVKDQFYTGKQVRPRMSDIKVTLNGNDVTSQFALTNKFGTNVDGKGTLTLTQNTLDDVNNFVGEDVVAEFNIVKEIVKADLHVYDANGVEGNDYVVTNEEAPIAPTKSFDFDGTAKTFADALLKNIEKVKGLTGNNIPTKATAEDFDIKYADNISGKKSSMKDSAGNHYNIAYVYAVGKEGSGYAGEKTITLADGSKIEGVVDYIAFAIKNVEFVEKNVTVTNGVYAGGLPVKPQVLIQINGNTLVEGKDYELKVSGGLDDNWYTDFTNNKKLFSVDVIGKGGYEGSEVKGIAWGIDKKDLKDCDVKVVNGVAYVMNGYIPVPTTEYTVKDNGDKTYTVTANETSKNYTGSKTVVAEGQKPTDKPETPMIEKVNVVGNKATVILSGETEGAVGYDYVISRDKDCINNKDYDKVNKNILNTTTDFTYVGQDVYYAYCHAWKRGEDGKKIFSDWSNAYPFVVSAITPSQPAVTSVKVKGSSVTVTYTKSSNADGYDVVLGSKAATVAGEKRPVEYGELVKKNQKTTTVTFKNVKKGTYYVGLHAFNRTSEDGKKVFSPWSNVKKVTVK